MEQYIIEYDSVCVRAYSDDNNTTYTFMITAKRRKTFSICSQIGYIYNKNRVFEKKKKKRKKEERREIFVPVVKRVLKSNLNLERSWFTNDAIF